MVVAISAGLRWEDYGTETSCWLSTRHGTLWSFLAPVLAIIAVNLYVFIRIMHAIFVIAAKVRSKASRDEASRLERLKKGVRAAASFLCLLGS